jgi:hypothetical protein
MLNGFNLGEHTYGDIGVVKKHMAYDKDDSGDDELIQGNLIYANNTIKEILISKGYCNTPLITTNKVMLDEIAELYTLSRLHLDSEIITDNVSESKHSIYKKLADEKMNMLINYLHGSCEAVDDSNGFIQSTPHKYLRNDLDGINKGFEY